MLIPVQSPPLFPLDLIRAAAAFRLPAPRPREKALRSQWLFAEPTGLAALDLVGGVNGVLTPSVTREPHGPNGLRAVHITGANDSYVSFGTGVGQFGVADFTVALWLKTSEQRRYFDIVGNRTEGSHGVFFCIRMTGVHELWRHGIISVEVDQNGANYVCLQSSRSDLNDGEWHHVAAVREGGVLTVYVDGKPCGTTQAGAPADIRNGHDFRLGRSLEGVTDLFAPVASYADLRVYDAALDDQQVSQICASVGTTEPSIPADTNSTIALDAMAHNAVTVWDNRELICGDRGAGYPRSSCGLTSVFAPRPLECRISSIRRAVQLANQALASSHRPR